ncbi:hypothetical protein ACQKPE_17205 [Pseudomonas sp. NPDC089554]|uniref:hypothetical protein n=1 Tax=Pseudomonas sp. NPDC089554 TaxID=3390653 RepID=UPI003CFEF3EB
MISFSDIATAADDVVQGLDEALRPTRARALRQASQRLGYLLDNIVDSQQFLDNAVLMLRQVADQVALEVVDLRKVLPASEHSRDVPWEVLRGFRNGMSTFKTIFKTVGYASTGGLYIAQLSVLSVSRLLTTVKPVQDGIEMVRLGIAASPVTSSLVVTGRAATLARLARCAEVFGKIASMLGVVVNICEVILKARGVAEMRGYKQQIDDNIKALNDELPQLGKSIEELVEVMQSLYLPLALQEGGKHVAQDSRGHRLVLEDFFAAIRSLPEVLEAHGSEGRDQVRALIVRLYDQSALARAAFVEGSHQRQHGLAVFKAQVDTVVPALRSGVTLEQARGIFSLIPDTLLDDLAQAAKQPSAPRLELDHLGEIHVRAV